MNKHIYTVSALVRYLKDSLDQDMNVQSVLIQGEISNFTNHRSGHWYFSIKDAKAKLSCVMFASYACRCKVLPKEGMRVIVKASLSVYEAQGNVQLYVTALQSDGIGDLYLQYEELKRKLAQEGLFDPSHKKPLPAYPMHIVLISAKEGAAIQDMLHTIERRWPIAKVDFLPSLVQGKEASKQLIERLKQADNLHPDVILLARGGGSIEDLYCFNEEALARCIYACESVIVSGVGHETDTTLVDYVSDARAPTPTAAAELVTPDIKEVAQQLLMQKQRLLQCINHHLTNAKDRFQTLCEHRYIKNPLLYVQDAQLRIAMMQKQLEQIYVQKDQARYQLNEYRQRMLLSAEGIRMNKDKQMSGLSFSLSHAMHHVLQTQKKALAAKTALLDAYSPLKILSRGYGVIYDHEHVIKSVHETKLDAALIIRMQDGVVHTTVNKKEEF